MSAALMAQLMANAPAPTAKRPPRARVPAAPTAPARPKFAPRPLAVAGCELAVSDQEGWINVVEAPAYFPLAMFMLMLCELCEHPERNSTLILRADILEQEGRDTDSSASSALGGPRSDSPTSYTFRPPSRFKRHARIRRRLLPRRPIIDGSLTQECFFYEAMEGGDAASEAPTEPKEALVVLCPEVATEADIPYYHPKLRKLAFRYTSLPASAILAKPEATADHPYIHQGTISIAILPFAADEELSATSSPPDPESQAERTADQALPNRTYRTCLHLLETLHKHACGRIAGYQKRRHHDVLVEKTSFQDLYLVLKERHKHLDSRERNIGSNQLIDYKRHVWKDVALAAFLMLLWRDMYPANTRPGKTGEEWDRWGRAPAGFVDLGCGNGLLVHILTSEGYAGIGLELRARKTWPKYPQATQDVLVESAVDPTEWFPRTLAEWQAGSWPGGDRCPLKEGSFLIGNHADEMTPWIPLLSLIPDTPIPFLSLPCCLHRLTGPFTLSVFRAPEHDAAPADGWDAGLETGESRYKAYLMWLGYQGLLAGWAWEKEVMRVPSTRGWAIVGRKRWTQSKEEDAVCRQWALEEVQQVRAAGGFTVREKEGKAH